MKESSAIKLVVYGLLLLLLAITIWLVYDAPASFLDVRVVYQGF